ncbi:hypothetical protein ASE07_14220 [Noviherbaspirillum sp. Root189]|nr:hypothetical protein ASE07_14220 [Noviherbaspirillum sp. Root189]
MLLGEAYIVFNSTRHLKEKAMTTLALNAANRSYTFLATFIDALDKAVAMAKASHHNRPSAEDMRKVRAIAETI